MKKTIEIMLAGYLVSVEVELLTEFGLPDEYKTNILNVVDLHKNAEKTNSIDHIINNEDMRNVIIEKAIDEFKMSL